MILTTDRSMLKNTEIQTLNAKTMTVTFRIVLVYFTLNLSMLEILLFLTIGVGAIGAALNRS